MLYYFKEHFIRFMFAAVGSLLVFMVLPAIQYLMGDTKSTDTNVLMEKKVIMNVEKKKEEKKKEPRKQLRKITTQSRSLRTTQSEKFKFAPDLGVEGNQGVEMNNEDMESRIFDESETDEPPILISMPRPVYPLRANQMGISGRVEYLMVIDPSGRVVRVTIVKTPHELLKQPVIQAARASRWKPAKVKGVPVMCQGKYSINFSLAKNKK